MSTGKDLHDYLLEKQPPGVKHEDCVFCAETASDKEGEHVTEEKAVLSQEQHEALLASAVTAAEAGVRSEVEAEVLRLTTELDEVKAAKAELESQIQELEDASAERERLAAEAELADARAKQVSEISPFTDEQLEARKESWGKMSEEAFAETLESYQEIVEAAKAAVNEGGSGEGGTPAPKTKFDGTRASAGKDGNEVDVVRRFFGKASEPADK
jgi:hypothetical protein